MGFDNYYPEGEFELFKKSKKAKKKKKKLFKKVKKFFKKLGNRVIDMTLSTLSQMALRFFDRKLERAYA